MAAMLGSGIACAEETAAISKLPAYILQLPAAVGSALIAETDTSTMYRYEQTENGIEPRERRYMSVGENGVGKQRAWDRRTPLGIYFANEQLDTSRMHERYGVTAFPLDYPNAWDHLNERSGDGIWIHGVAHHGGRRPPLDTDGCIALPNEELLELEKHFQLLITPVIVTRRIEKSSREQIAATRDELKAVLDDWVQSFRAGDWHRYLSLYADEFEYRGLDRDEWSAYRTRSAATRSLRDYSIDDVLLLADPEQAGLFLSRFRQTIVDANGRIVTIKRLYWQRSQDGVLRIIAEDNG